MKDEERGGGCSWMMNIALTLILAFRVTVTLGLSFEAWVVYRSCYLVTRNKGDS